MSGTALRIAQMVEAASAVLGNPGTSGVQSVSIERESHPLHNYGQFVGVEETATLTRVEFIDTDENGDLVMVDVRVRREYRRARS